MTSLEVSISHLIRFQVKYGLGQLEIFTSAEQGVAELVTFPPQGGAGIPPPLPWPIRVSIDNNTAPRMAAAGQLAEDAKWGTSMRNQGVKWGEIRGGPPPMARARGT